MQAWTEHITLRHAAAQPQSVRLREPRGADELALTGIDTMAGANWLDTLLDTAPCRATELSASDRDALYAALHRGLWGDRIVSSLACAACGTMYDLSFTLSALQRQLHEESRASASVEGLRTLIDTDNGESLRLPDAPEEDTAAQLGIAGGVAQLAGSIAAAADDIEALALRLETLAPLIDVDLDTCCAECGHAQAVRFDIQSFVLQRVLDERESVLSEVHALASGYGWSLGEITGLPRSLRRSLAARLQASSDSWT